LVVSEVRTVSVFRQTRRSPEEKGKVIERRKARSYSVFVCYAKGNFTQRLILELYVNGFESNPSNCFYILPCRMISARLLQRGRQRA